MSKAPAPLIAVDRPHSFIGPSSFERVETCTASVLPGGRLRRSSGYADEGTCAHVLFEAALEQGEEPWVWLNQPVTTPEGAVLGEVDYEMVEAVTPMVDYIRETLVPGFRVERKLMLHDSAMYGYADVIGVSKEDGKQVIADLKYGAGIYVPADTVQLGLYALMTLLDYGVSPFDLPANFVASRSVILQPRAGKHPIREHDWTSDALIRLWKRVEAVEHRLAAKDHRYKAGDHCRWCDRAGLCPQLKLMVRDTALATVAFDPADPGDIGSLEDAIDMLPAVEKWVKAVRETMQGYIEAGGSLRNARLVRGRNARQWGDPAAAEDLLTKFGVDPFAPREMLTVAAAEKKLPKAAKAMLVHPLVQTITSKPRVAIGDEGGEAADPTIAAGFAQTVNVKMAAELLAKHGNDE